VRECPKKLLRNALVPQLQWVSIKRFRAARKYS
jgi:hypothetical protein